MPRYWGATQNADHCQCLCWSASAERPCEQPGQEDAQGSGDGGEHPDSYERSAEDQFSQSGLECDEWAVIDVAPCEMAAAHEVVELVAKVAVADVRLPHIGDDMQGQLDGGKDQGQT